MEALINLLERKNLCFRSFHKLCAEFLDKISAGDTTDLEQFQRKRQGLINVLEKLELDVKVCLEAMGPDAESIGGTLPAVMKEHVSQLLLDKDAMVKSILDLDLQILSHIDRIKDETIRKLQSIQTGRKTIGAYKSPIDAVETAESNKTMDREA